MSTFSKANLHKKGGIKNDGLWPNSLMTPE
jgi:hypothetical protein